MVLKHVYGGAFKVQTYTLLSIFYFFNNVELLIYLGEYIFIIYRVYAYYIPGVRRHMEI